MQSFLNKKLIVMVCVTGLALTGCQHRPVDGSQESPANNEVAATYGVNDDAQYNADQPHYVVNALTAPANQTYYFDFSKSDLHDSDMKALLVQANYLVSHPSAKIRLQGNTDIRGSREFNIGLGWRRAQSVARLLEQQGVRPDQIKMVSYGSENPVAQGTDSSAYALNRRVELVY